MIPLNSLLEVANLGLVFELNILERFNEFLENIDEILGLVIVFDDRFFIFVDVHLILKLLSEASILIDQHFEPFLNILMILVVMVAIIEFLNRFSELVVDFDEFLQ